MTEVTVVGDTLADISFDLPLDYLHHQVAQSASAYVRNQSIDTITLPFGSKLEASSYVLTPGGSGANVAVGLQQAGMATTLVTGLSTDPLGVYLKDELAKTGLRLGARENPMPSNLSVVLRIKAERSIITVRPDPYEYLKADLPTTGHLHIGPLPSEQDSFFERLLQHSAKTSQTFSCNPRKEALAERGRHLMIALKSLHILFANQEEGAILARLPQRTNPPEIVRALRRFGPKIVVVTCGEKGAYIGVEAGLYFVPALSNRDERRDATGAGDAFVSGFLAGYLQANEKGEAETLRQAIAYAALNSAAVVTVAGGQKGLLLQSELEREASSVTLKKVEES